MTDPKDPREDGLAAAEDRPDTGSVPATDPPHAAPDEDAGPVDRTTQTDEEEVGDEPFDDLDGAFDEADGDGDGDEADGDAFDDNEGIDGEGDDGAAFDVDEDDDPFGDEGGDDEIANGDNDEIADDDEDTDGLGVEEDDLLSAVDLDEDDEIPPSTRPDPADLPAAPVRPGDRIAKVMARAGIASRRDAERMILEGRVKVNGATIKSPALDVLPSDRVVIDGTAMEAPQETRLWLYYKPVGLVTSEADEKGRQTIFDALPRDLPRVMTIGRLDLTSEGLLLLTNDGALKRRLELPSTGWMRRYRVRVNGQPNALTFEPLRRGVEIDGETFQPMEIEFDTQQGANAWLTVGIREGKNREIRRAMAHVGLTVNRLIRIAYGPFRLTGLEKNEVREVKRRVLRDQLGGLLTGEEAAPGTITDRALRFSRGERPRPMGRDAAEFGSARPPRAGGPGAASRGRSDAGPPRARPWDGPGDRPAKPRFRHDEAEGGERRPSAGAGAGPRPDRPRRFDDGDRKPREGAGASRPWQGDGARPDRPRRFDDGDRKPREGAGGARPWQGDGARPDRPRRFDDGDRKPREGTGGARPWQGEGARPDRPRRFDDGDRKPREGAGGARPWQGDGARSDRPKRFDNGDRPRGGPGEGPRGFGGGKPGEERPGGFARKPRHGSGYAGKQGGAQGPGQGGDRSAPARPRGEGDGPRPFKDRAPRPGTEGGERPRGPKPQGERRFEGNRPGGKPGGFGDRPRSGPGGGPRGGATGGKPQGGPKGPRPSRPRG